MTTQQKIDFNYRLADNVVRQMNPAHADRNQEAWNKLIVKFHEEIINDIRTLLK